MSNSPNTVLYRLRALKSECGPNKHDQAIALITACILEGWNTAGQIVGALKAIGMKPGHIWIMLDNGTGASPGRHYWRRDEDGRYSQHDNALLG